MKILIADDDTTSRLLLDATLQKLGHAVTQAADGAQALDAWRRAQPDVVISDWMMPGMDGLELCRRIRAEPALQYTYLLLLTSLDGKQRYLDGMQAGADDFINKPHDEDTLAARLHVAQRILSLHHLLREEATHDRLTGLWNRAAILDHLQQAIACPADAGRGIAVILADLDHFKAVNDLHGHAAGDYVLRESARRLQSCLPGGHVGRYGGEEFLAVLRDCTSADALAVADAMRNALRATAMDTGAASIMATASLGVALAAADPALDAASLIAAADRALYRAKAGGRDRVEAAPDPLT